VETKLETVIISHYFRASQNAPDSECLGSEPNLAKGKLEAELKD